MAKPKDEMNPVVRNGLLAAALAVVPGLLAFAYVTDDSTRQATIKAERIARQEAKYRQLMYDEIDRRLGNEIR